MSAKETTLHPSHKVNRYRSKYGLQHRAFTHIEQHAIKGPQNHKCKTIQTEKPTVLSIYKTRNIYEQHQQTTTTEHKFFFDKFYNLCFKMVWDKVSTYK